MIPFDVAAAHTSIPPGTGKLRFTRVGGRTVLTRALAASPLKLLNPRHAGPSAWVYLATYGGGLLGGDALTISVGVEHGAAALLATQASTKVYRSELRATQQLRAHIAGDSLFVALPDPVTCFCGARYVQQQCIQMDASANLLLVDWLTAGRVGCGERWKFSQYETRTMVWRDDCLAFHDALSLVPEDGEIAARLDRFNCLASAVVIGPAFRATASRLTGLNAAAPAPRRADLLLSAAPLGDDGALLRVAGLSVEHVGTVLRQHLGVVSSLLGDDPWSFRW